MSVMHDATASPERPLSSNESGPVSSSWYDATGDSQSEASPTLRVPRKIKKRRNQIQRAEDFSDRVNVVRALNLPSKAQQLCLKPEEQNLVRQLKSLLSEGPEAFVSLAAHLQDQLRRKYPVKMLSRSSSVHSSRKSSQVDVKQALEELDMYYWKTHQDFLDHYNSAVHPQTASDTPAVDKSGAEKTRGRSRRVSIKETMSKLTMNDPTAPRTPCVPANAAMTPAPHRFNSSPRSKSWAPTRRSTAKVLRQPSPSPSFRGRSEYVFGEEARAKLRTYLTASDKFQEALDYGFPTVMPTANMRESPVISPPPIPSTHGRNLSVDVQRFMKNNNVLWLENDADRIERQDARPQEPFRCDSTVTDSQKEVDRISDFGHLAEFQPKFHNHESVQDIYTRDVDINDFKSTVDDSPDDRRTPSPASPTTPTTPEAVPLPLSASTSISRLSPTSLQCRLVDSSEDRLKRVESLSHYRFGDRSDSISPLSTMVRTAPDVAVFQCPDPHCYVSHAPSNSLSSNEVSERPTVSGRTSKSYHHRYTSDKPVSPVSPTATCPQRHPPASPTSLTSAAPAPDVSDRRLLTDTKPLPPPPLSHLPLSPISPTTPKAAKQHKRFANKHTYDTPSAYMTPRTPPAIDNGPRQMTLRMTLTRPELRAPEEDIYGSSHVVTPAFYPKLESDIRKPIDKKGEHRKHGTESIAYSPIGTRTIQLHHGVPSLSHNAHQSNTDSNVERKGRMKTKATTRRVSEIEVVRASSSMDTTRGVFDGRPIVHPDLPPHVLMRKREMPTRAASKLETSSEDPKREPSKFRKTRTEPDVSAPVRGCIPENRALQTSLGSFTFPAPLPRALKTGHAPAHPPLAQMGQDGEWRLISPSVAAAQGLGRGCSYTGIERDGKDGGDKRTSLWKKMSWSGTKNRPGLVLP